MIHLLDEIIAAANTHSALKPASKTGKKEKKGSKLKFSK